MQSLKKSQSAFTKRNYKYVFTGCDLTKDFGEDGNFPRINYLRRMKVSISNFIPTVCRKKRNKE